MRKIFVAVLTAFAILFVGLAYAPAANAADDYDAASLGEASFEPDALPKPATVSGYKFWSPSICMAIGDTGIEAPAAAQYWNNVTSSVLQISARNNCVTAGYPASRRFTITSFFDSQQPCQKITDVNGGQLDTGDASYYNGMWRWTNNPILWVNKGRGDCLPGTTSGRHSVSSLIGVVLGMKALNSAGYNSRVMNSTTYSWDNVPWATSYDGQVAWSIYTGAYGG